MGSIRLSEFWDGKVKALQLSAQIEIAKRMIRGERNQQIILDEPEKFGNSFTLRLGLIQLKKSGFCA